MEPLRILRRVVTEIFLPLQFCILSHRNQRRLRLPTNYDGPNYLCRARVTVPVQLEDGLMCVGTES